MRRKLNFTGRKRLAKSVLAVTIVRREGVLEFRARLDLTGERIDTHARVFVEAYYRYSYARFDYGTVEHVREPADRRLTEFESTERVQFRLKIVAPDGNGRILALLDGVSATVAEEEKEEHHQPILPVNFRGDMAEVVWRLAFDESGPSLEVNANIDGIREFVRTDRVFFALVFPTVVGEVIDYIARDPIDFGDDSGWWADWLRFINETMRIPAPIEHDEMLLDEWRQDVVTAFAGRHWAATGMAEDLRRRAVDES
jgi:hypothetical protein